MNVYWAGDGFLAILLLYVSDMLLQFCSLLLDKRRNAVLKEGIENLAYIGQACLCTKLRIAYSTSKEERIFTIINR